MLIQLIFLVFAWIWENYYKHIIAANLTLNFLALIYAVWAFREYEISEQSPEYKKLRKFMKLLSVLDEKKVETYLKNLVNNINNSVPIDQSNLDKIVQQYDGDCGDLQDTIDFEHS